MAGICKYCGFSGTNDELADHAGECSEMLRDYQPDEPKIIDRLYDFWFRNKYLFPNGMLILIGVLLIGTILNVFAYKMNKHWQQILFLLVEQGLVSIIGIYTVVLILLKNKSDKK